VHKFVSDFNQHARKEYIRNGNLDADFLTDMGLQWWRDDIIHRCKWPDNYLWLWKRSVLASGFGNRSRWQRDVSVVPNGIVTKHILVVVFV
jgi:hypothetical protein